MILIDTNVFVDHLRGHDPATKFFEALALRNDIIFSAITETELVAGKECKEGDKKRLLLNFLRRWNKISVSNQIAVLAGDLARDYSLDVPDAIIAATALVNEAELLTKNIRDFKNVSGLKVKAPY